VVVAAGPWTPALVREAGVEVPIEALRVQIHAQTVLTRAMPPGNITKMTDEERALLDRWVRIK